MGVPDENSSLSDAPASAEIERLFVINPKLDQLRAKLNHFNPIKTMGMERMEIRHSAILGWLLDPQETHGLRDDFLRNFLAAALRNADGTASPTALDVIRADMSDAEVRREWRNIDLFVLSPSNGWAFVIENKFDSKQHSEQLSRYLERARKALGGDSDSLEVRGIFLTLGEEEPKEPSYTSIRYDDICEILPPLIEAQARPLHPEVQIFIGHYLYIINEATGMSEDHTDMEKLAKELYTENRKVIDFIVEHGTTTEFAVAAESVFGEGLQKTDVFKVGDTDFVFSAMGSDKISFLPKAWWDALHGHRDRWHGCETWETGCPLIVRATLIDAKNGKKGKIALIAEVGPIADHGTRAGLIDAIEKAAKTTELTETIKFTKGATDERRKYSRFFKKNTKYVSDVNNPEEIAEVIKKLLEDFSKAFSVVAEAVEGFVGSDPPSR